MVERFGIAPGRQAAGGADCLRRGGQAARDGECLGAKAVTASSCAEARRENRLCRVPSRPGVALLPAPRAGRVRAAAARRTSGLAGGGCSPTRKPSRPFGESVRARSATSSDTAFVTKAVPLQMWHLAYLRGGWSRLELFAHRHAPPVTLLSRRNCILRRVVSRRTDPGPGGTKRGGVLPGIGGEDHRRRPGRVSTREQERPGGSIGGLMLNALSKSWRIPCPTPVSTSMTRPWPRSTERPATRPGVSRSLASSRPRASARSRYGLPRGRGAGRCSPATATRHLGCRRAVLR